MTVIAEPATTTPDSGTSRAAALADRIEQGAALLAAFAETLSEAEWDTPVSATDRRPIGVIVHHVASVYPIEVEVARAIASGKAMTEVTWDAIAEMNAKHAGEKVQKWAGDAYHVTSDAVGDFGKEVTALVRKHPIPSILIGFGIGLLLGRTARMI